MGNNGDVVDAEFIEGPTATAMVRVGQQQLMQSAEGSRFTSLVQMAKMYPRDLNQAEKEIVAAAERLGSKVKTDGSSYAVWCFPIGKGRPKSGVTVQMTNQIKKHYGNCISYCTIDRMEGSLFKGGELWGVAWFFDAQSIVLDGRPFIGALAAPKEGFAKDEEQANRFRQIQVSSIVSKMNRGVVERNVEDYLIDQAKEVAESASEKSMLVDRNNRPISIDVMKKMVVDSFGNLEDPPTVREMERLLERPYSGWTTRDCWRLRMALTAIVNYERGATVDAIFRKPAEAEKPITVEDVKNAPANKAAAKEPEKPKAEVPKSEPQEPKPVAPKATEPEKPKPKAEAPKPEAPKPAKPEAPKPAKPKATSETTASGRPKLDLVDPYKTEESVEQESQGESQESTETPAEEPTNQEHGDETGFEDSQSQGAIAPEPPAEDDYDGV